MTNQRIAYTDHPIDDEFFASVCRDRLAADGALLLPGFFSADSIARVMHDSGTRESEAFHADSTHNVYLTPIDPGLGPEHPYNRQVASSKGLLADDEIPIDSPLREIYTDYTFRRFLCRVLGIDEIHPYADNLSSINVHFAAAGEELGWHFDNSSFAVTMLLRAPHDGGVFEYVPSVRGTGSGEMGFERVDAVLDGDEPVEVLRFASGDLVVFRGREALHRVTPVEGPVTRMLVVFAFNDAPDVRLSASALMTLCGRTT